MPGAHVRLSAGWSTWSRLLPSSPPLSLRRLKAKPFRAAAVYGPDYRLAGGPVKNKGARTALRGSTLSPRVSDSTARSSSSIRPPKNDPLKRKRPPKHGGLDRSLVRGLAFALALSGDGLLGRLLGLLRLLCLRLPRLDDWRQLDLTVRQLHQHRVAGAELRREQRFGKALL